MHILVSMIVGGALFLFPGYALLTIFKPWLDFDFVEMLCASVGVSIAVVPIVIYVYTLLGLRTDTLSVILLLLITGLVTALEWGKRFLVWKSQPNKTIDSTYLLLAVIFVATLVSRIWMVKDLAFPLWTDSYHHVVITQIISDNGIVPSSYEPYAPIESFTYHFGFHTLAAWFHWLSGVSVSRAVVLVGQIINALVVPTTFLFVAKLFHNRTAGLVSSFIVGLGSNMPDLFVNWGRYPQLAGQILLAVLVVLTVDALDVKKDQVGKWILVGIGAAAIFLVHNRILLFYGLFAGILFLIKMAQAWRDPEQRRRLLLSALIMGGVALVIDSFWILRFFSGFGGVVAHQVVGYAPKLWGGYFDFDVNNLLDYGANAVLLGMAAIAAIVGLSKKSASIWLLLLWFLGLFVMANVHLIGLTPFFPNNIVFKVLYLLVSALIGYGAMLLLEYLRSVLVYGPEMFKRVRSIAIVGALILCVGGAIITAGFVAPENGFVRDADLVAMNWISQNTAPQDVFYIATYFWTPDLAHGLDAGYWIPLFTKRQTTVPMETYESDGSADYIDYINQRSHELMNAADPQALWKVLNRYNINYIYLGSRKTYLDPEIFLSDPGHFLPVYSQNDVWIFRVQSSQVFLLSDAY